MKFDLMETASAIMFGDAKIKDREVFENGPDGYVVVLHINVCDDVKMVVRFLTSENTVARLHSVKLIDAMDSSNTYLLWGMDEFAINHYSDVYNNDRDWRLQVHKALAVHVFNLLADAGVGYSVSPDEL